MRGPLLPGAGALALVIASCAAPTAAVRDGMSAEELVELVAAREQAVRSMTGSGRVSFSGPAGGGTAEFTMALRKPDSLLVQVEGPFGIDVGTLFVGGGTYVMYNSLENTAYTGTPGDRTMRSVLPVDLSVAEIMSAFSGMPVIPPAAGEGAELVQTPEGPEFSVRRGQGRSTYRVDPALGTVVHFRQRDAQENIVVTVDFSDFRGEGAEAVPASVDVALPARDSSLRIRYRKLAVNGDTPSFRFSIPPDARIVRR